MKFGPKAKIAISHVARGHTLRSRSLRSAWSRVVASGRAGAAVRQWKAAHRPPPPKTSTADKEIAAAKSAGDVKTPLRTLEELAKFRRRAIAEDWDVPDTEVETSVDYALPGE